VVVFRLDHYVPSLVHKSYPSLHANSNETLRKIYSASSFMNRQQGEASVPPYIPDFASDTHSRQIFTEIESAIELGRHSVSLWIDEEKLVSQPDPRHTLMERPSIFVSEWDDDVS